MGSIYLPTANLGEPLPKTICYLASGEEQLGSHTGRKACLPSPIESFSSVTRPTYPHTSHPSTSNLPPLSLNLMLPTDCEEMEVLPRGLRTYLFKLTVHTVHAQPQLPPSRITTGPGLGLLHLALKSPHPQPFPHRGLITHRVPGGHVFGVLFLSGLKASKG